MLGRGPGLLAMCEALHYDLVALHLRIQMAAACARLGRQDEGRSLLEQALAQAAPDGFVVPFAENFSGSGTSAGSSSRKGSMPMLSGASLLWAAAQQERCGRDAAKPCPKRPPGSQSGSWLWQGSLQTAAPTKRSLPGCSSPKAP